MSDLPEGRTLVYWHAPGYDIVLGFAPDDVYYGVELAISGLWW
jgi:hypothetical protein